MSRESSYTHSETSDLVYSDAGEKRELDEIEQELESPIEISLYHDLVSIYGEDAIENASIEEKNHLEEIGDGVGCTEIWAYLSERDR